ncbi:general secretion pathway protein GspK [Paraneptunicella aestuarii]|uniref:type II secretion system protein GspK n=1 Tax=Paraneptunicella aestuarii TaxID=2831148 RepID=UPI001E2B2F30|nr:type II secretion system protein GspK [Paraneptunicella aestuarii]UAA39654.1 general secretion pathway protein GspK [Paraneptunicella aestuarii]
MSSKTPLGGREQRGAALIFALLVALLLGVFAAFFTYKAQQNIQLAQDVSKQLHARLKADNQLKKAIYAISRLGFVGVEWPETEILYPSMFWGEPLEVGSGVTVSYQDLASKLNLVPFKSGEWLKVLMFYGVDEKSARGITDRIEDWMDSDSFRRIQGLEKKGYQYNNSQFYPRDALMQSLDELFFIPGIDERLMEIISNEASYWGTSERAPLAGSEAMIKAYGGDDIYEQVLAQRKDRESLRHVYNSLQGVDPGSVSDIPSGLFRISVNIEYDGAKFARSVDINLRGTDLMPFYIYGWQ